MLWAWGVAVIMVGLRLLKEYKEFLTEHVLVGFGLLAALVLVPVLLSVLTWKWLSGKEMDDTRLS